MNNKVIVALDYETEKEALGLVDQLEPSLCRLKVGKEMFTTLGTNFVKQLHNRKFDVFLDLKERCVLRQILGSGWWICMPVAGCA